jgi:hypothetical protein
MSWMWTLAFGYHEDHTPTHGYGSCFISIFTTVTLLISAQRLGRVTSLRRQPRQHPHGLAQILEQPERESDGPPRPPRAPKQALRCCFADTRPEQRAAAGCQLILALDQSQIDQSDLRDAISRRPRVTVFTGRGRPSTNVLGFAAAFRH